MNNNGYGPERQSMSKARAERKKRRQRKRRAIILLVTFVVFFAAIAILCVTCFFKIKAVHASGKTRYSSEQIIENCGIKVDDNMLLVLQKNVKKTLSARLPYVDEVTLIKKIDGSIEVRVSEAKAAYSMEQGGLNYLMSDKMVLLEISENRFDNTILLQGLELKDFVLGEVAEFVDPDSKEVYIEVLKLLEAKGIRVETVNASDPADLVLTVDEKYAVKLGSDRYLEKKINHLGAMLEKINNDLTGVIDLSYWSPENTEGYFKQQEIDQYLKKQ